MSEPSDIGHMRVEREARAQLVRPARRPPLLPPPIRPRPGEPILRRDRQGTRHQTRQRERRRAAVEVLPAAPGADGRERRVGNRGKIDRKSTRLNSSHVAISYAVFCLKKKKIKSGRVY